VVINSNSQQKIYLRVKSAIFVTTSEVLTKW